MLLNAIKRRSVFAALFLLSLLFGPRPGQCDTSAGLEGKYRGYNVILFVFDAMRPDHLGCYGYGRGTSLTIDSLAREGVLFENAFSQSSLTLMSVASLFTSLYPFSHGVRHISRHSLSPNVYTLARIMQIYGYRTAWFGEKADPHTGSAPGLLNGFEEVRALDDTVDASLVAAWIRSHRRQKFFVTVHCYATHDMSFPLQRYRNVFNSMVPGKMLVKIGIIWDNACRQVWERLRADPDSLAAVFGKEWISAHRGQFSRPYPAQGSRILHKLVEKSPQQKEALSALLWKNANPALRSLNKEQVAELLLLLDSAIYEIDTELVARVVTELKKTALYDKTIIIITADHGNEFNEHGHFGHGAYVYDESIRIPLIFRLPNFSGAVRLSGLAESVDVLPTLLEMIGITVPFQAQGMSWVQEIGAESGGAVTKEHIFSESVTGLYCIRSARWKLIASVDRRNSVLAGNPQLFDMKSDPFEKHDLVMQEPVVAKRLADELLLKLKNAPRYQSGKTDFFPQVDEKMKEQIRKTGYW